LQINLKELIITKKTSIETGNKLKNKKICRHKKNNNKAIELRERS
jgi:hypothetical protein